MDHAFLSAQDLSALKVAELVAAMRRTVILPQFAVDPLRFSTKSLRAAGVPEYVIMKAGRWRSLAFLQYVRLSLPLFDATLNTLSNIDSLCFDGMRRLSPGFGDSEVEHLL